MVRGGISPSSQPLDPGWCISSSCEPKPPTGNLGVCCQRRDTELEKALGPQANEDIEKELQALSKSTRIHCS